jgi:hypothetical protein
MTSAPPGALRRRVDLDLKKRRASEIICCGVLGIEFFVLSEHKRL